MLASTRMIVFIALIPMASGCVSAGRYDALVAERDGLEARSASLQSDKTTLESRVETLKAENTSLSSNLTESERKVSDLTSTHDGLVANLQAELASGHVEILRMRDGIQVNVADDVLFSSGSAQIDEGGLELLGRVAEHLRTASNPIRVEGHTDDVPIQGQLTARYPTNWELAGARAASVVRLMAEHGVEGTRMRAVSSGEFAPRAPNDSDEGRARNRRIEIRLLPVVEATDPEQEEVPAAPTGS